MAVHVIFLSHALCCAHPNDYFSHQTTHVPVLRQPNRGQANAGADAPVAVTTCRVYSLNWWATKSTRSVSLARWMVGMDLGYHGRGLCWRGT
jgi:hypothetical protein